MKKQAKLDELELELAELRANRKRLSDLGFNTFSHFYHINLLENQIAAIKKAQAVLPEISSQLRAWRGERGIRVIVALLNDDGIEISVNEVAFIERGELTKISPELLQKLGSKIGKTSF